MLEVPVSKTLANADVLIPPLESCKDAGNAAASAAPSLRSWGGKKNKSGRKEGEKKKGEEEPRGWVEPERGGPTGGKV